MSKLFKGLMLVATGLLIGSAVLAQSNAESGSNPKHCVAIFGKPEISEKGKMPKETPIIDYKCFDNFSDSLFYATKGTTQLPKDLEAKDFTGEVSASTRSLALRAPSLPINTSWDGPNKTGSSLTWYGSYCNPGVIYTRLTMPTGWDNVISSSQPMASGSGCGTTKHYDNPYNNSGNSFYCYGSSSTSTTCGNLSNPVYNPPIDNITSSMCATGNGTCP